MPNDSVRIAFNSGKRSTTFRLSLELAAPGFPEYVLKQDNLPVALIRGKEVVCGGEHFAVIPILPLDWEEQGAYRHGPDNVPYWDVEQRLRSLNDLLYNLSAGWTLPEALDDAVDAQDEDDAFFAGIPTVAYTGQQPEEQPEDYPLPVPIEWEPEPTPPAKIYPWTFWYRGRSGNANQVILEATYEDAQRVWDRLSTTLDMTSTRP